MIGNRFLIAAKVFVQEIHRRLCVIYGAIVMPAHAVWFWDEKFESDSVNMHDDAWIGRPREMWDNNTITTVLAVFEDDTWYTIDYIQEQLKEKPLFHVSRASICQIVNQVRL